MEIADAIKRTNMGSEFVNLLIFAKLNFTWMNNLAIMLIGPNESICEIVWWAPKPHTKFLLNFFLNLYKALNV